MSLASIPYHAFAECAADASRPTLWGALWARAARWVRRGVAVLGLGLATYLLLMALLLAVGLRHAPRGADVMLVLGTTVRPSGEPGDLLRARLDRAVELYNAGFADTVIVSGGQGAEGVDEATVMRAYLVARGVPGVAVLADSAGVDTFSSARFTAEYLREHSLSRVLVVSQAYHLPRAAYALRQFGVTAVSGAAAYGLHAKDPYGLAREVPACLYYGLRSYPEPANATTHAANRD